MCKMECKGAVSMASVVLGCLHGTASAASSLLSSRSVCAGRLRTGCGAVDLVTRGSCRRQKPHSGAAEGTSPLPQVSLMAGTVVGCLLHQPPPSGESSCWHCCWLAIHGGLPRRCRTHFVGPLEIQGTCLPCLGPCWHRHRSTCCCLCAQDCHAWHAPLRGQHAAMTAAGKPWRHAAWQPPHQTALWPLCGLGWLHMMTQILLGWQHPPRAHWSGLCWPRMLAQRPLGWPHDLRAGRIVE